MTLLIVDMQPTHFRAAKRCSDEVVREARRARRNHEAIVVLEYFNSGITEKRLKRALGTYDRVVYVEKKDDDGSFQFLQAAIEIRGSFKNIRICGVNTCCCVFETVKGVLKQVPDAAFTFKQDTVACSCKNPGLCKR